MSRKGSQPLGLVANLDFTADDLNNYFYLISLPISCNLSKTSMGEFGGQ